MDPNTLLSAGLTPQQVQQLMQLGVLAADRDTIANEMAMAAELRRTPMARGRFSGRGYDAAHPLEFISGAMDRIRGGMEYKQGVERQRENAQRQAELRALFLNKYLQNQPQAQPQSQTQQPPVPQMTWT